MSAGTRVSLADGRIWVTTLVTLALLSVFAIRIDLSATWAQIQDTDYIWLPVAAATNLVAQWARGVRHHYLLEPTRRVPIGSLTGAVLIASAVNNALPLRGGEVARVQLLGRRFGISRTTLAATLAAEVVLDTLVIAAFLLLGIVAADLGAVFLGLASAVLAAAFVALLLAWFLSRTRRGGDDAVHRILRFLPEGPRGAIGSGLLRFEEGWSALWSARHAGPLLLSSAAIWGLEAVAMWVFGIAVGLDLTPIAYVTLVALADIVTSLTFTPAGLGAFEVSVSELLRRFGVGTGTAGAYVLLSHAILILSVMLAGVVAFFVMRVRWDDFLYLHWQTATAEPTRKAPPHGET
jgi:uncharacterized protein (TIRG00374 family)